MSKIQVRRGTAAAATSSDVTLAAGEFGYETDTGRLKIGDGLTAWTSLPYVRPGRALDILLDPDGFPDASAKIQVNAPSFPWDLSGTPLVFNVTATLAGTPIAGGTITMSGTYATADDFVTDANTQAESIGFASALVENDQVNGFNIFLNGNNYQLVVGDFITVTDSSDQNAVADGTITVASFLNSWGTDVQSFLETALAGIMGVEHSLGFLYGLITAAVPNNPTDDGTYHLAVTVTDGVASRSWVLDT